MGEDEDHQRGEKRKCKCGQSIVEDASELWHTWKWAIKRTSQGELYIPNLSILHKAAEVLQEKGMVRHFKFWEVRLIEIK